MRNQARLPFELDPRAESGVVTAHGGVPLVIEAFRVSGAAAVLDEAVVIKRRKRGLAPSALVEGLFSLWAAGRERADELATLREDGTLALLLGHGLPAPQTARDFLDAFDEAAPLLWRGPKCHVPGEGARVQGLAKTNRQLLAWLQARRPQKVATLDVDATILDSQQRSARWTLRRAHRLPAGGGALGRAGRGAGRRVPRRQRAVGDREPPGDRAGAGGTAGGRGRGAAARRQRALRAAAMALAGSEGRRLRDQRRHGPRAAGGDPRAA